MMGRRHARDRATAYISLDGLQGEQGAREAESALTTTEGVIRAEVSEVAEKARVIYQPSLISPAHIAERLGKLGLVAHVTDGGGPAGTQDSADDHLLMQLIVAVAFGMQVMLLYFVQLYPLYTSGQFDSSAVRSAQYLVWGLATPALFFGGWSFLSGAGQELRHKMVHMDTLVALGTLAAYGYSTYGALVGGLETYFDSVAMITAFIVAGKYIEAMGRTRARKDVRGLMSLQPDLAWRSTHGELERVAVSRLKAGDIIVAKQGERIPVDATVQTGRAQVDESLLTGESVPRGKSAGDGIWAGTLVADGTLTAVVTADVAHSRLTGIRDLVMGTLGSKAPVQRMADTASMYLATIVIFIAIATAVGWHASGQTTGQALLIAVSVLVVACPCALGLATPLAISVSLARSARDGILVRNAAVLETASHVSVVVFDKTGTITTGHLSVSGVGVAEGEEHTLLCQAASVEQLASHPVATAIVEACRDVEPVEEFESTVGVGVSAVIMSSGRRIRVGGLKLMAAPPPDSLSAEASEREGEGETVVWVGDDEGVLGYTALADSPSPSARKAVSRLAEIEVSTLLLSGDTQDTTAAIAGKVGIADFSAGLTPEQKAERIGALSADGAIVAMVGDGANDAPALAKADVSITVSGGSDIAGETSDAVLTRDDLMLVPWLLKLSAITRRVITENLAWAFAYNVIAIPLAAFGLIRPSIAAAAMATSSVLVVMNSVWLGHRIEHASD